MGKSIFSIIQKYSEPKKTTSTLGPNLLDKVLSIPIEAEKGEVVLTYDDKDLSYPLVFAISGKKHKDGGTPLDLPENSFIFSDDKRLKIEDKKILELFGESKPKTPAEIARKYITNDAVDILKKEKTDTAKINAAMSDIDNKVGLLAVLALVQEQLKGNNKPPVFVQNYLQTKGLDVNQFLQNTGLGNNETEGNEQKAALGLEVGDDTTKPYSFALDANKDRPGPLADTGNDEIESFYSNNDKSKYDLTTQIANQNLYNNQTNNTASDITTNSNTSNNTNSVDGKSANALAKLDEQLKLAGVPDNQRRNITSKAFDYIQNNPNAAVKEVLKIVKDNIKDPNIYNAFESQYKTNVYDPAKKEYIKHHRIKGAWVAVKDWIQGPHKTEVQGGLGFLNQLRAIGGMASKLNQNQLNSTMQGRFSADNAMNTLQGNDRGDFVAAGSSFGQFRPNEQNPYTNFTQFIGDIKKLAAYPQAGGLGLFKSGGQLDKYEKGDEVKDNDKKPITKEQEVIERAESILRNLNDDTKEKLFKTKDNKQIIDKLKSNNTLKNFVLGYEDIENNFDTYLKKINNIDIAKSNDDSYTTTIINNVNTSKILEDIKNNKDNKDKWKEYILNQYTFNYINALHHPESDKDIASLDVTKPGNTKEIKYKNDIINALKPDGLSISSIKRKKGKIEDEHNYAIPSLIFQSFHNAYIDKNDKIASDLKLGHTGQLNTDAIIGQNTSRAIPLLKIPLEPQPQQSQPEKKPSQPTADVQVKIPAEKPDAEKAKINAEIEAAKGKLKDAIISKFGEKFYVQDVNNIVGALGQLVSIKKYLPYQPYATPYVPRPVYQSPDRQIQLSTQQANQAANVYRSILPQGTAASAISGLSGQAAEQAANIEANVQAQNVGIANQYNAQLANLMSAYNQGIAKTMTQLYDKNITAEQQYDNARKEGWAGLLASYNTALTNRANRNIINKIYLNDSPYKVDEYGNIIYVEGLNKDLPSFDPEQLRKKYQNYEDAIKKCKEVGNCDSKQLTAWIEEQRKIAEKLRSENYKWENNINDWVKPVDANLNIEQSQNTQQQTDTTQQQTQTNASDRQNSNNNLQNVNQSQQYTSNINNQTNQNDRFGLPKFPYSTNNQKDIRFGFPKSDILNKQSQHNIGILNGFKESGQIDANNLVNLLLEYSKKYTS